MSAVNFYRLFTLVVLYRKCSTLNVKVMHTPLFHNSIYVPFRELLCTFRSTFLSLLKCHEFICSSIQFNCFIPKQIRQRAEFEIHDSYHLLLQYYIYYCFFRDNFLRLDIFYRQLSYEEITQQKAFDFYTLICKYDYIKIMFV